MKRYTVDARAVRSFDDFIEAANVGFIRSFRGEWNGNLDAFHDYLSWGDAEFEIELLGSTACARALGHEAQATWLRARATRCRPADVPEIEHRLALAEAKQGKTLFDVIHDIIADNPHITLVLR